MPLVRESEIVSSSLHDAFSMIGSHAYSIWESKKLPETQDVAGKSESRYYVSTTRRQKPVRRRSGARGDSDAPYLVLEELASLAVYLFLHICR
jgi:hypothetical protein